MRNPVETGRFPSYDGSMRMAALWGYVLGKAQASKTVDRWFWRLPHGPRRILFRACRLDCGVPQGQASEVLSRKTLFIHVPKTAGTSVQRSLFGREVVGHQTFRQYELALSQRQLTSLFKFAFVRNPWDRLVSAWAFLHDGGYNHWDRDWAEKNLAPFPDFASFVLQHISPERVENDYWHFRPQVYYLRNGRGQVTLDFLGRFRESGPGLPTRGTIAGMFGHVGLAQSDGQPAVVRLSGLLHASQFRSCGRGLPRRYRDVRLRVLTN